MSAVGSSPTGTSETNKGVSTSGRMLMKRYFDPGEESKYPYLTGRGFPPSEKRDNGSKY